MSKDINWDSMGEVALYIHYWAERTFPGRNPNASLMKLVLEEVPELLLHKKQHGLAGIDTELADAFILLMDLAVIWRVDLRKAIREKMAINERRMWRKDEDTGFYSHGVDHPPLRELKCTCWVDPISKRLMQHMDGCPVHPKHTGGMAIVESEGGEP